MFPLPKKFEISTQKQEILSEKIEGLPATWLLTDQQLSERYGPDGLSLAYKLFSSSTLGVVTEHDVGRRWAPTLLREVRWTYQRGNTQSLLLQPAFAALQDEKKTAASERVKAGLAALYQGPTSGADTSRIASKITKLLNGSFDDTVWLMRLAYYYIITAVTEQTTGNPVAIVDAMQEQLVSAYTQSGFASNLTEVITSGRDVVYIDHDGPLVTNEMISAATYIIDSTSISTPWGVGVPNLPKMTRPLVFVQGREAGLQRADLSTLEHDNVASLVGHYVSMFNAGAAFERALKTMAFLMSRGSGGPLYTESYLLPASKMQAAVAGYLLTGPAAVVSNSDFPTLVAPTHSFYEGTLRRMFFEASLNGLRHSAGVHHLAPHSGRMPNTIVRAWEMLLATGREGGYAAALDQMAEQAGWKGALAGLLRRHSFTTHHVQKLFDSNWAVKVTQWAELLPWVNSYPTQASVLARLAPVKLVSAKSGVWQPVADVVGRDGATDAFLTIMMESTSAEVAAKFSDGLTSDHVKVPRLAAHSTGWQADFSIPTMMPHLGGFTTLQARLTSDVEIVRLMGVAARPATTWKIKWYDTLHQPTPEADDNRVLWYAMKEARLARTAMDPAVLEAGRQQAAQQAEIGAQARSMAEDDIQYSISLVSHLPQYSKLAEQYEATIRLGADLTRSGLFMDAVRDMSRTLDDVDHIEAAKCLDPDDRALMVSGMARLCDLTAQLSEANATRTNLGRMASGLRAVGQQLEDNPALTLDEYRASLTAEATALAEGLRGREATAAEKDAVYRQLWLTNIRALKARELPASAENDLRQAMASGGEAGGWLDGLAASAALQDEAKSRVEAIVASMDWKVATPDSETLAREAARNGHNPPELASNPLPEQAGALLQEADFISGPSSAEGGSNAIQQTSAQDAPTDTQLEDEQPMRFEA